MEEKVNIKPIKLSDVERMVTSVKRNAGNVDVELSFEFILTAFFPTCWDNIQEALHRQYTLGYIEGTKETEKVISVIDTINDDADCYCE